jgi:periplasmic protein TonB
MFSINRNGQMIGRPEAFKSSGNPLYDRAALRAVEEAAPFPPLPEDFKAPFLRPFINFNFGANAGRG